MEILANTPIAPMGDARITREPIIRKGHEKSAPK